MSSNLLGVVFSHYFRNYYRSKSFYLMLILIFLVSALMTYFSFRYSSNVPVFLGGSQYDSLPVQTKMRIFSWIWEFVLAYVPVFASVFFGSPAISSEIESKTAFHIFSLPIGRYTLIFGKFLAAMAATVIIVAIYMGFQVLNIAIIFSSLPPIQFYYSFALIVVFITSILSFTFMISSIFNKNLYAYITVFVIYFLVFNALDIVILVLYNYTPTFLLSNAAQIIYRVYVNISTSSFSVGGSLSGAGLNDILLSILIMLLYTVVSLVAAVIMFERKEVK